MLKNRCIKTLCIICVIAMLCNLLFACKKPGIDESTESGGETDINMMLDIENYQFDINTKNEEIKAQDIALFDRDYKLGDSYSLYPYADKTEHSDRAIIIVEFDGNSIITTKKSPSGDNGNIAIPVNGCLLSISSQKWEEIKDLNIRQLSISNYEFSATEDHNLSTFYVDSSKAVRRINLINPEISNVDGKIYLIKNAAQDYQIKSGEKCFELIESGKKYTIESELTGSVPKGKTAIVFNGEYNIAYANEFLIIGEKMTINKLEVLSGKSDETAVILNDKIYQIGDAKTNPKSVSDDGVYLFNVMNETLSTFHSDINYRNIVIFDNKINYVSEKNTPLIIPTDSSVILMLTGELSDISYNIGDEIETVLINEKAIQAPEKFIKVLENIIEINNINSNIGSADSVLYTNSYGSDTDSLSGTFEIAFCNGVIENIGNGGSMKIPENGFVFSTNKQTNIDNLSKLEAGEKITATINPLKYSIKYLPITDYNTTRLTDYLVVYNNGSSTDTNQYGYEIGVDSNGIAIESDTSGNMKIPKNGFVVSGHGKNMTAMQEAYSQLCKITIDSAKNEIVIQSTPLNEIDIANYNYEKQKERLEICKNEFFNINYKEIYDILDKSEAIIEQANTRNDNGNLDQALLLSITAAEYLNSLEFLMFESRAVENRASWYRANEKNDAAVEATVLRAKELNINALYIETWYNGQVISTSNIPLVTHNTGAHGDFDALESFIKYGKLHGIEIHAWVENFFIGTTALGSDSIVKQKPEWHMIDRNGVNYFPNEYGQFVFMNPYNRECRDLVLEIYRELLENYELDGLHLDYIRFSEPQRADKNADFGYNDDIIKGFQAKYNTTIDPHTITENHSMWLDWCKFREDIINSFVKEVYDLVQEVKPEIWLTAAVYPEFRTVVTQNYQNFRDWVDNSWMDEIFSMSYSTSEAFTVGNSNDFVSVIGEKAFFSAGLSAFGETVDSILAAQIAGCYNGGANGSNLFSFGSYLTHANNYVDYIAKTVYRNSSVQTYKNEQTIHAGTAELIGKINNVYKMYHGSDENNSMYDKALVYLNELNDTASKFDSSSSNHDEIIKYLTGAAEKLDAAINEITINNEAAKHLKSDLSRLLLYVTQSLNRTEARK